MSDGPMRQADGRWLPGASASPSTKFQPGKSANPGGMSKTRREIRELAREHMPDAIRIAGEFMRDPAMKPKERTDAMRFLAQVSGCANQTASDRDSSSTRRIVDVATETLERIARMKKPSEMALDGSEPAKN